MNLRDLLITTMDQLAGNVRGLVVWHRGRYMRLIPNGDGDYSLCAQWSASARADNGMDTVLVIGVGATPLAALDDCADKIDAIENPEPYGYVTE